MTLVPPGAQLAPVDLPPPPPGADPREPSPTLTPRQVQRGSRTPQRTRSPLSSRDASPVRPLSQHRSQSSELGLPAQALGQAAAATAQLHHPVPRSTTSTGAVAGAGTPSAAVPIHGHHLSRPSSPSSIHSSGSAIFERDIELPPVASLSLNPNPPHQSHTLNHKSSRLSHLSHGSALDHTVPAVLDDAVEALTAGDASSRGFEGLEIEAPAPSAIGMARQSSSSLPTMAGRKVSSGPGAGAGALHSRSPSPISIASRTSSVASPAQSPPILSQLGAGAGAQQNFSAPSGLDSGPASPTAAKGTTAGAGAGAGGDHQPLTSLTASVPRPSMPQRISTGPQVPGGWAFGGAASASAPAPSVSGAAGVAGAGAGANDETASSPIDESPSSPIGAIPAQGSSSTPPAAIPAHLSPNKSKHRISFLSYNDLLLSVPTQVTSLEDITSGNLSPDHLPGTVSPSMSTRSPVIGSPVNPLSGHGRSQSPPAERGVSTPPPLGLGSAALGAVAGAGVGGQTLQTRTSWEASGSGQRLGGLGLGEGEWERQGLGKGLEQRLEEVAQNQGQT